MDLSTGYVDMDLVFMITSTKHFEPVHLLYTILADAKQRFGIAFVFNLQSLACTTRTWIADMDWNRHVTIYLRAQQGHSEGAFPAPMILHNQFTRDDEDALWDYLRQNYNLSPQTFFPPHCTTLPRAIEISRQGLLPSYMQEDSYTNRVALHFALRTSTQMNYHGSCGALTHKSAWIFLDATQALHAGHILTITPNHYLPIHSTVLPQYLTIVDSRYSTIVGHQHNYNQNLKDLLARERADPNSPYKLQSFLTLTR